MNHFAKNRNIVQKSALESGFIKPLTQDDLPLEITEASAEKGKLKKLILENVPVSDEIRPKSWLIDLELSKTLFSNPWAKKAEKAVAFFTCESLYVLLIEMKSSLNAYSKDKDDGSTPQSISRKMTESIGRISVLLTTYLFDNDLYNEVKIKYFGLVFYNGENWHQQANIDKDFEMNDLYKVFRKKNDKILLDNTHLQTAHKVNIYFIQNPDKQNNIEEITFDLDEFFRDDTEYGNGLYTEFTCP